jgi:hypothetical protein
MATDAQDRGRFRTKQKVRLTVDRGGVPAGATGKVVMVTGQTWVRYRVRFDDRSELGLLDERYLEEV